METTSKKRTPSRCREWERQRRNKFNDAISKLGAIVIEIIKSNDPGKDTENVQFPKLEIVQKALLCLNNFIQESRQLKAEILALQVKLDAISNSNLNKKDASTQVFLALNKKSKSKKYVKMLKKSQCSRKETPCSTIIDKSLEPPPNFLIRKLPKLLPRSSFLDKKGPENTIVVLPATPYIFPQRPLLFPTLPPAIVLVDPNLQALNKTTVPTVNRNSGDITKTTMVNILPISAYSRPLSATKGKKTNLKSKSENIKKSANKPKAVTVKSSKESKLDKNTSTDKIEEEDLKENKKNENACNENKSSDKEVSQSGKKETVKSSINKVTITEANMVQLVNNYTINTKTNNEPCKDKTSKTKNDINEMKNPKYTESSKIEKPTTIATNSLSVTKISENTKIISEESGKSIKIPSKLPETISENKNKGNKLPNILESSLCDNVVDGGNARLELAEEFLAASPTAAFLMSFPLVSGNRADSPAEEPQNTVHANTKDGNHRRNELASQTSTYFDKHSNCSKPKLTNKIQASSSVINKQTEQQKYNNNIKPLESKTSAATTNVSSENPFLNLPMPSLITANCTVSDTVFGLDFDCNISKAPISSQSTSYASNNNIFYKTDPFSTVKNTIYSTSSISSSHEYNGLGLYPCAMEKYTSKNKPDFTNVEDNLMKIGSSRLTYDIDLGWSHKGFDFVNCTTSANTHNKDNVLTTASAAYSTTYNPFTPDFHVPLVSTASKKDNVANKVNSSFAESITSFYSQPTNLWAEDAPFYTNNTMPKTFPTKHQNYLPLDHTQTNNNVKPNNSKNYETKQISEAIVDNLKLSNIGSAPTTVEKYTKKSPTKMHINWMTSEIRPIQNNCTVINTDLKEPHKVAYSQMDHIAKKQDEGNYFPISMHNFPAQPAHEEFQVWPSARPLGTTEISIDPPPINLPTLVGDLALGPHDKKKNADLTNRTVPQPDVQNCGNFLSVTQLMNRSTDNMSSRYHGPIINQPKSAQIKQNIAHFNNDPNRKSMTSRLESHVPQPCYVFNNEPKTMNSYDNTAQFTQSKIKANNKTDKSSKSQKNNYSAESLIRGGTCTQKVQDSHNLNKFMMPSQKYNDFNAQQDSSVAQVSHFPPILDYSDNSYAGQQFSGTTLYNTSTNTIPNSFYSNFIPGSSNLMSGNYTSGPFTGDFTDYNQTPECSYTNHKYEELKMRNNPTLTQPDKVPSNYKSSRRESTAKHKLECSKKETSKKYQNKRAKLHNEAEEWTDPSHLLWQNKASNKRHSNLLSEELPFPNYVGNQMPAQYQPDFFNSHFMPSNVQNVANNVDRSISSFPATSRANFNLSTIFPEITMKVQ